MVGEVMDVVVVVAVEDLIRLLALLGWSACSISGALVVRMVAGEAVVEEGAGLAVCCFWRKAVIDWLR